MSTAKEADVSKMAQNESSRGASFCFSSSFFAPIVNYFAYLRTAEGAVSNAYGVTGASSDDRLTHVAALRPSGATALITTTIAEETLAN